MTEYAYCRPLPLPSGAPRIVHLAAGVVLAQQGARIALTPVARRHLRDGAIERCDPPAPEPGPKPSKKSKE